MFKNINTETAFNRAGVACLAVSAVFTVLAVALDACGQAGHEYFVCPCLPRYGCSVHERYCLQGHRRRVVLTGVAHGQGASPR